MKSGDKNQRLRQGLIAIAVGIAAQMAAFAASSASLYIATPIGAPYFDHTTVTAINANGRLAGYAYVPDWTYVHAWVESSATLTDLGTLGGKDSYSYAINAFGHVTGYAQSSGSVIPRAFAYFGGALQDLGTFGGTWSYGAGINDNGQITGAATLPGDTVGRAFLYSGGAMTDLGTLGGPSSGGNAINNSGQITGWSDLATPLYASAFLYSGGTMIDLGTLGGATSIGMAINAAGQVTGSSQTNTWGPHHAFLYSNGVMTDLAPAIINSAGYGINANGDVVGAFVPSGSSSMSSAFIHTGGALLDLNDLVVSGLAGATLTHGLAINDSGQIVARGCMSVSLCLHYRLDPIVSSPGVGTVVANPYGPLTVVGGTLNGNTISNLQANAIITLGSTPGAPGSFVEIDFQGLSIAQGRAVRINAGAPGQSVVVRNFDATPIVIGGSLTVEGSALPLPKLHLRSPGGITVMPTGSIVARGGATIDALGATWYTGQALVNNGLIRGGANLALHGARITGGGTVQADAVRVTSFGSVNNPVNGAHFVRNGIVVAPETGVDVALTLNGYGPLPQVFNVKVLGNVTISMPSAWPAGANTPPNNAPVPAGATRPWTVLDPAFGGGSMIMQATGALTLQGGVSNDFVFPGGIVLIAKGSLNVNGVVVNNGWTTTGASFQGVFFESPNITGVGSIQVLTNDLNWVNFSTLPHAPVKAWQLVRTPLGTAQFAAADGTAPHVNSYSILSEAAAAGQCWICLVNSNPVNMQ